MTEARHPLTVLVVDDHPLVRSGIVALLSALTAPGNITQAADGRQALDEQRARPHDVVLVDLELPDMTGTAIVEALRALPLVPHIVVYTMHEEPWLIRALLGAEVDAVVLKGDDPRELPAAVEAAAQGLRYLSARFTELAGDLNPLLTDRELEVLSLMAQGLSSREIAVRVFVSENTIEYHRRQILSRIGARNVAQAVSIAIGRGLIGADIP